MTRQLETVWPRGAAPIAACARPGKRRDVEEGRRPWLGLFRASHRQRVVAEKRLEKPLLLSLRYVSLPANTGQKYLAVGRVDPPQHRTYRGIANYSYVSSPFWPVAR